MPIKMSSVVKNSAIYAALIVFAVIWLIPVVFMVFTAFKSQGDLFANGAFSLPKQWIFKNFVDAWKVGKMNIYFTNSLFISCIKVPLGILVECWAAFALTRLNFRYSSAVFIAFLIGLMIPHQVTLIPLNMMLNQFGLIDSYYGLILLYIGFGIPFGIFVLRSYMRSIPSEIDDAAKIDGCSAFNLFWTIIVPLAAPAIATLVIIDFLSTWNEFLLAQTFIHSSKWRTVPIGLLNYRDEYSANYPLMNAGVLISVIPIFVVYMAFQKYFVAGLTGSVKG